MKGKQITGFVIFCSLMWLNPEILKAQKKEQDKIDKIKVIFQGNHFDFNFSLLSTYKARLSNHAGYYPINTTVTPGLLLSFKYRINFNNYYSIMTGPEAAITGRNFNLDFNKDDFSPPLKKNYSFHGKDTYLADLILSLPVLFEKRLFYKKSKFLFANTGFRFNVSTGADFDILAFSVEDVNNGIYEVAEVNVYANNNAKAWISFPGNFGHGWLLKNNNVMQLAITSNLSFTKYVNGTYQVTIPNKPAIEGSYSSTGSYIGLSMNYVFTNANYRIRKGYEKRY